MRADVKSFTYWVMHNRYSVRYRHRSPTSVDGILTTPDGETEFVYNPQTMTIRLPDRVVTINRGGWETSPKLEPGDQENAGPNEAE